MPYLCKVKAGLNFYNVNEEMLSGTLRFLVRFPQIVTIYYLNFL